MKKLTRACHCCGGSGKEPDPVIIGEIMKCERVQKKMSIRKTAKKMGISHAYLYDMENGRRSWSEDMIKRFKKALK